MHIPSSTPQRHSQYTFVHVIIERALRRLGFDGPYHGGKHPYMIRGDLVLTIPNPHRADISVELLKRILKQASITQKEWRSAE
jgi:predicted RNA binding protein YcfA (HicA-like mRNA interferase family)